MFEFTLKRGNIAVASHYSRRLTEARFERFPRLAVEALKMARPKGLCRRLR
jgi:hypothetical protein